jgi:NhaP-type Na+/H+ or K+/H+ antiporter
VTIIFLPISTVASVMGMNTADVRNMDKTQWVFWATALPLTVVVIVVSLFAAGILMQPFGRGADLPLTGNTERTRKRRNRRRKRGFVGERSLSSSSDSLVDEVD